MFYNFETDIVYRFGISILAFTIMYIDIVYIHTMMWPSAACSDISQRHCGDVVDCGHVKAPQQHHGGGTGSADSDRTVLCTTILLSPLSVNVEIHNATTLEDAMARTQAYERRTVLTDDMTRSLGCTAAPAHPVPWSPTIPNPLTPAATNASSRTPSALRKPLPP